MTTHTLSMSDGAKLFLKVLGDDGRGKPLLIAHHGAPGLSSHAEPEATFGFLQDRFRIIVYDARGSGESDLKPPYTHERWVQDLDEIRAWAGAKTFVLAGGSYGGFIAQEYALAHGDRVRAMILRDTWAWGSRGMMNALKNCLTSDRIKPDPERQYRMWSGILIDDDDFEAGVAEMTPLFAAPHGDESGNSDGDTKQPPQKEYETTQTSDSSTPKRTYHAATQNFAFAYNQPRFDIRHRLSEIKVPTLVVAGRLDLVAPLEYSEEIASGIPNAQLAVFHGSGHNPGIEEPEKFRGVLDDFVSHWKLA